MLQEDQEQFGKLKANRKLQVSKIPIKPLKPVLKKDVEKSEAQETKAPPKDEKKGGKMEKEKANAKATTKHIEMNGHTQNSKLKNSLSLKRKLSTA